MLSNVLSVGWEFVSWWHTSKGDGWKTWKTYTKTARGGGSLPAIILDVTNQSIVMVTSCGVNIFESTLQ